MKRRVEAVCLSIFIACLFCSNVPGLVIAQTPPIPTPPIANYAQYIDLSTIPKSNYPQVIEIPFQKANMLLYDATALTTVPLYSFSQDTQTYGYTVTIEDNEKISGDVLIDNKAFTYIDIGANNNNKTIFTIFINPGNNQNPKISGIEMFFDQYSMLPTDYTIETPIGGDSADWEWVVLKTKFTNNTVRFPNTFYSYIRLTLYHIQPLRISDIKLMTDTPYSGGTETKYFARFTALPNHQYRVYRAVDKYADKLFFPEIASALQTPLGNSVIKLNIDNLPINTNPVSVQPDRDNDGVPNVKDNCPKMANTNQQDDNHNGVGDVCDDFDQDGVLNVADNCPQIPNALQGDVDGDKIRDVCDGVESRVSEKYPWLPWLGIIIGFIVTGGVLIVSLKKNPENISKEQK